MLRAILPNSVDSGSLPFTFPFVFGRLKPESGSNTPPLPLFAFPPEELVLFEDAARWQTLHLETWFVSSSPLLEFKTLVSGTSNSFAGSTVVNQKLNLSEKKAQVPRAPWHSKNGCGRNCSRHDPVDDNGCPAPVLPAAATWWAQKEYLLVYGKMN